MMKIGKIYIGVDPATGEEQQHDCTAIVAGLLVSEKRGDRYTNKMYILPEFVNKRMGFSDAIKTILDIHSKIKEKYNRRDHEIRILIENAGQQKTFYDQLRSECRFPPQYIELVSTSGIDKKSRISGACSYVEQERVLFPKDVMTVLIDQLVYFKATKHDDMADAFAMVVNRGMQDKVNEIGIATAEYFQSPGDILKKPQSEQEKYYRNLEKLKHDGLI